MLDDVLDHSPGRVHLAASAAESGESPLVLGGYCVRKPDEHNRMGIGFLHGVVGDRSTSIRDLTAYMVKMLSAPLQRSMHDLVGDIAVGQQEVWTLIAAVLSAAESLNGAPPRVGGAGGLQVRSIVHDCGGAALAWMAMAQAHGNLREPWQFRDVVHESGALATTSSVLRGTEIMLSDYLSVAVQAVDHGLAVGTAITSLARPDQGEHALLDDGAPAEDDEADSPSGEIETLSEPDWDGLNEALWPVVVTSELACIESVGYMSGLVLRGRFKIKLRRSDVIGFETNHAAIVLTVSNRRYWPDRETMTFVVLFVMSTPELISDLHAWLA
ncbi:hypothetical protein SK854_19285 [Lentzea sp. BCCO 10_0061]|uniref:Uncharacterized protein n=1 Tax=Lentzea sokolovensis TaxID=3095429 RepID=A0ABU4UXS6_9PSEU|nr:hypothetical protein [Lentzea sp. BCCO 10_0061]MDX8144269.1 hypothetical protein [Lentzea sp. BCCO 10_0061]